MMRPPGPPPHDNNQTQQATQPDSQDAAAGVDAHLWGYLLPCNPSPAIQRVDFFRMKPTYTLGRDRTNSIIFAGRKVSNFHCEIRWNQQDATVVVKDLSSNGTYINGDKIGKNRFAALREGNEIAFGTAQPQTDGSAAEDYRFIYRYTASGPPTQGLYAHYELEKELGKGSFATVMKAFSKKTGINYAVKMIQANKLRGQANGGAGSLVPSESAKWAREISILEQLNHPNICQLKEVFFEASNINLVLEYVNGGDLLDYIIKRNGLSEPESQDITFQLCTAMSYIHERGITHRDLKPENVLMTNDVPPIVKVADFGLAKMVDSYTMLRTMCGTPSYLAPEVVLQSGQEGYHQVVDSWSVGVIVFSTLTNVAPFETMNAEQLREAGVQPGQPLTVKQQVLYRTVVWSFLAERGVSDACVDFLRRLLQSEPKTRMSLTAALEHPWLVSHDREQFAAQMRAGQIRAGGSGDSAVIVDASMYSVAPDMSLEDPSLLSQPGPIPGAYITHSNNPNSNGNGAQNQNAAGGSEGVNRDTSRLFRRRDILIQTREEPDANPPLLQPSQEMMDTASAEEEEHYASTSRPNKRKGRALDYDSSLTPMPEENEEGAANGIQDLSMADIASSTASPAPQPPSSSPSGPTTRSKRPRAGKAPNSADDVANARASPKPQGKRGKQQQRVEELEKPARRSARLNDAASSPPQKGRRTGRRS